MLPRPLPQSRWLWLGVLVGPSLIDYWCDLGEPDGDTLSEHIRAWFHVDTPAGRVAFTAALAVGSTWLHSHILKELA